MNEAIQNTEAERPNVAKVTVYMDPGLHADVKTVACALEITLSEAVSEALAGWADDNRQKAIDRLKR